MRRELKMPHSAGRDGWLPTGSLPLLRDLPIRTATQYRQAVIGCQRYAAPFLKNFPSELPGKSQTDGLDEARPQEARPIDRGGCEQSDLAEGAFYRADQRVWRIRPWPTALLGRRLELEVPKPTTPVGTSGVMDREIALGFANWFSDRSSSMKLRFRRRI